MSAIKKLAIAIAAGGLIPGCVATPAYAATQTHCGVRANWRHIVSDNGTVRVRAWVRGLDGNRAQVCGQAIDTKGSPKRITLEIDSYGYDDDESVRVVGADSATALLTTDGDTYAVTVRGTIDQSWPAWNLASWNRG